MSWYQDAYSYLNTTHIRHQAYTDTFTECFAVANNASPGEVVCITGPSRVGKSRLTKEVSKMVDGEHSLQRDGVMPTVYLQANNDSIGGAFSTKSFALRALNVMQQPFLSINFVEGCELHRYDKIQRTPEASLRLALEGALIGRKTKYLIVDEAHHIRYVRGGDKNAAAIMDSFKCLASNTGVILVLVGAYPLLDVLQLSPHLLGRKHQVHFPRYQNDAEGLKHFEALLKRLSDGLPFRAQKSLRDWNKELYAESLGCIGLLMAILRRAVAAAQAGDAKYLERKHLVQARRPNKDYEELVREIEIGERNIAATRFPDAPPVKRASNHKPFKAKPKRHAYRGRN